MGALPDIRNQYKANDIKCVVFDFDGVLVDSNVAKRNAYFEIFAPLGATDQIVDAALKSDRGGDRFQIIRNILRLLAAAGFLEVDNNLNKLIGVYAEQYNDICEHYAATCREIVGVSVTLHRLAMRYTLYVNSATPEESLRRIIRRRGWKEYFKDILGRPRTKTENLIWILEHERISGNEIVFVGDSQHDLDAALRSGSQFVGMVHDTSQFKSEPSRTVSNLLEAENVIDYMCCR